MVNDFWRNGVLVRRGLNKTTVLNVMVMGTYWGLGDYFMVNGGLTLAWVEYNHGH